MIPTFGLWFFLEESKHFKLSLAVLVCAGVLSAILSYFNTYLISELINNIGLFTDTSELNYYIGMILLLYFLSQVAGYASRRFGEALPIKFKDQAREVIYKRIISQPFNKTLSYDKGLLHSEINEYLNITNNLVSSAIGAIGKIASFIIAIYVLSSSLPLSVPLVIVATFFLVGIFVYLSKKYIALSAIYSDTIISLESRIKHMLLASNQNKTNKHLLLFELSLFNNEKKSKWWRYDQVKSYHAYRWFVQLLSFNSFHALFLGITAYSIVRGQAEIGDIVLVNWIFSQFSSFVIFLTEIVVDARKNYAISDRVAGKINGLVNTNSRQGKIQVGDSYINTLDIDIKFGKSNLVLGDNGIGKSINLLAATGALEGRESQSDSVSMMTSNDILFDDLSIRENVLLEKFDGYVPEIANRSEQDLAAGLSSGEKQIVRLYRCINAEADIYIFDEPCVNLDTTDKVSTVLNMIPKGKTVVVISHQEIEFEFDNVINFNSGSEKEYLT